MTTQAKRPMVTATTMISRIKSYVEKVSAATNTLVANAVAAKETVRNSPLVIWFSLSKDWSEEMRDELPVPDSNASDTNKPDKFQDTVDGKTVNRSFYRELADDLPFGKTVKDQIKLVDDAGAEKPEVQDNPYSGLNKQERRAMRRTLEARLAAVRSNVKDAAWLFLQFDAFAQMDKLSVRVLKMKDKDGNMVPSSASQPIVISASDEPANFETYSIQSFLRMDADEIKALGGDWEAVKAATKRQPKTPQTFAISKVEEFEKAVPSLISYMENSEKEILRQGKRKDNDDFLLSLASLQELLDSVTAKLDREIEAARDRYEAATKTKAA